MPRKRWYLKSYEMEFSQSELFEEDVHKEQDYFPFTFYKGSENEVTHFLPNDILEYILLYIPAYPYYFSLRRVCKQWLEELENRIYFRVEQLNLIPRFQDDTVRYKPFLESGYTVAEEDVMEAFKCVVKCFPNTKHITSFSVAQGTGPTTLFYKMCEQFSKLEKLTLVQQSAYTYAVLDCSKLNHLKILEFVNFHRYDDILFPKSCQVELNLICCSKSTCFAIQKVVKEKYPNLRIEHTLLSKNDEHNVMEQLIFIYENQKVPLSYEIACGVNFCELLIFCKSSRVLNYLLSKGFLLDRQTFVHLLQRSVLVDELLALCSNEKAHLKFSIHDLDSENCTLLLELLISGCREEVIAKAVKIGLLWCTEGSSNPFVEIIARSDCDRLRYLIDNHIDTIPVPKDLLQSVRTNLYRMVEIVKIIWRIQKDVTTLKQLAFQHRSVELLDLLLESCPAESIFDEIPDQVVINIFTQYNYSTTLNFLIKLDTALGQEMVYTKQWMGKNLIQLLVGNCNHGASHYSQFIKERIVWLKKPMFDSDGKEILLSHYMKIPFFIQLIDLIDCNQIDPTNGNTRMMNMFCEPDMEYNRLSIYCDYVGALVKPISNHILDVTIKNNQGKNLPYLFAAAMFPSLKSDNFHAAQYCCDILGIIPLELWLQKANNGICALAILLHAQHQTVTGVIMGLKEVEETFERQIEMPMLHYVIDSLPNVKPKYLSFFISKLKHPQQQYNGLNALQFAISKPTIELEVLRALIKSIAWDKETVNSSYLEIGLSSGLPTIDLLIKNGFDVFEKKSEAQQKKLLVQSIDKQLWDCCLCIVEHFGNNCIIGIQQLITILQHMIQQETNYNYNKLFKQLGSMLSSDSFLEQISKQEISLEKDTLSLILFAYYHLESNFIKQIVSHYKTKLNLIFKQQSKQQKNNAMHCMALRQVATSDSSDTNKYKHIANQIVKEYEHLLYETNVDGDTCFHLMCQHNTDLLFYLLDHKKAVCIKGLELKNSKGLLPLDMIQDQELRSSIEIIAYPKRKKELAKKQNEVDTAMSDVGTSRRGTKRVYTQAIEQDEEYSDADEYVPEEEDKKRTKKKKK